MREKLLASQQIYNYEEWYAVMESFYFLGFITTDPHDDYEVYVQNELKKW